MAVFGLIVLLEEAPSVFTGLQLVGCGLLAWYGWSMWTANHDALFSEDMGSTAQGFAEGFAIAFFNPKIALFLVAVLAQVLQPDMNLMSKAAVGLLGMVIDTLWYVLVALVLTGTRWLDRLKHRAALIHRLTALVLWGFGLSVLVNLPIIAGTLGSKRWNGCSVRSGEQRHRNRAFRTVDPLFRKRRIDERSIPTCRRRSQNRSGSSHPLQWLRG